MKKKIDWLNHGLEFFVVIIGILIAFQLNTCSANRKLDKSIKSHKEAIIAETAFNLQNLSYAKRTSELSVKKIDSLLMLIEEEASLDKINKLVFSLGNGAGYFYYRKNALKALEFSGDFSRMTFDEKKEIVSLYEFFEWINTIDLRAFGSYNEYLDYIKENLDLYSYEVQDRMTYNNKEFVNILSSYNNMLNYKIGKYNECKEIILGFQEAFKI